MDPSNESYFGVIPIGIINNKMDCYPATPSGLLCNSTYMPHTVKL